jgi:hypothetical protein
MLRKELKYSRAAFGVMKIGRPILVAGEGRNGGEQD